MPGKIIDFLHLSWPLFAAIIAICLACLRSHILERVGLARVINVFNIITLEKELTVPTYRALLVFVALLCFAIPAFRDYSKIFPELLRMEVFFDDEGLEAALKAIPSDVAESLRPSMDWKTKKKQYFDDINRELSKRKVDFRFSGVRGVNSSVGETTLKAQPLKWGLQTYRIVESQGRLTHTALMPDNTTRRIDSDFEILDTPGRLIQATLADVYWRFKIAIVPEFKQTFRISPSREIFVHSVAAVTVIQFFPYIDIGRTVYFKSASDGSRFAIGYAVYSQP
jgi:hypothetical protein